MAIQMFEKVKLERSCILHMQCNIRIHRKCQLMGTVVLKGKGKWRTHSTYHMAEK